MSTISQSTGESTPPPGFCIEKFSGEGFEHSQQFFRTGKQTLSGSCDKYCMQTVIIFLGILIIILTTPYLFSLWGERNPKTNLLDWLSNVLAFGSGVGVGFVSLGLTL